MAGICGWFGDASTDNGEVIQRMQSLLGPDRDCRGEHHVRREGAIASGGVRAAVVDAGSCSIALCGHPRWSDGSGRPRSLHEFGGELIEAYRNSGADVLSRVHGDFALALLDAERGHAIIAIDRMGVHSIVYQQSGASLLFGTSADALSAHPDSSDEIDHQGIYNYVYYHMVPGPGTALRGQQRLLPGQYAIFRRGQLTLRQYWRMAFPEEPGATVATHAPEFLAVLEEGVRASLNGERCGAFLSGGTDSSTICGMIGRVSGAPANTFSIGFDAAGFDEMSYARIAATHFRTAHHEYYVTPDDVLALLPRLTQAYDQPFGNASAVPTYYCASLARENGIDRMLGGDGGDELFGGNARYAKQHQLALYHRIPRALRAAVLEPILLGVPSGDSVPLLRKARSYLRQASPAMPHRYESYNLLERLGAQNVFTREFLETVDVGAPKRVLEEAYEPYRACSLVNQMLGIDLKLTLADSDLPKVTRMCELAGVDVTFPLLHESVVGFSGRLPAKLKLHRARLRYFFKEALRGFLPDAILSKEKHGFGLPAGLWLSTHAGLKAASRDALSRLRARSIVDPSFLDRLLADYLPAHPNYYGTMVWVLMMLELWLQKRDALRASPR